MKTTLEIPDPIFRRAKAEASEQGIPLRQFVSEAVAEKLKSPPTEEGQNTAGGRVAAPAQRNRTNQRAKRTGIWDRCPR